MQSDVGIKAGYPRLPFSAKLRAYVSGVRPFTLLGPVFGVAAALGMIVQYGYDTWPGLLADWHTLLYGAVTLLCVQMGSNLVNQGSDAAEDALNRPWRPVPAGHMTRDEAFTLGTLLWVFAVLRASTLNPAFGLLIATIITTSLLYSLPPARLKARIWLGNIGVATARGLLGLPAAWTITAPWNAHEPWTAGIILFVFLVGATTAKDFGDAKGDKAAGVHNLVTSYGPAHAKILSLPLIGAPILLIPLAENAGLILIQPWAYVATILILIIFAHRLLFHDATDNVVLEGQRPWAWMYLALLTLLTAFGLGGYLTN